MEGRQYPPYMKKLIDDELLVLEDMPETHHEFGQRKQLLELMIDLPFGKTSPDILDMNAAKKLLDSDHYGIDLVKSRILQFIAVSKLKGKPTGKIFLLAGPPGVGKTSIASSIAKCLGRKFVRISLGGEYDVAVIKGHRRTYIGTFFGNTTKCENRLIPWENCVSPEDCGNRESSDLNR